MRMGNRITRQCLLCLYLTGLSLDSFSQKDLNDLFSMSMEDLLQVEVSSSSKYTQKLNLAHSNMQVITREEISTLGFENIAEALRYVNGFYLTDDRNYSYVGIRGFGRLSDYNDRILLMIDGHILNENVYGSAFLGNDLGLDLNLVDRIEVIQGPGAALYGNGAMIGVVHIITRSLEREDSARLQVGAGSHGQVKGNVAFEKASGKASYYAGLSAMTSQGENLFFQELNHPDFNHGIAKGLDGEHSYAFYGRYKTGDFEFKAMGSYRDKGIPTGAWETSLSEQSETVDKLGFAELSYQKSQKNQHLLLSASWDIYHYSGEYVYSEYTVSDVSLGKRANLQADYQIDFRKAGKLLAGMEFHYSPGSDYRESEESVTLFYQNNPFFNASAYSQYEVSLSPKVHFLAGLRGDYYDYTSFSLNPRLSMIYTPSRDLTLRLSMNKAFRAPNFYEMYYESRDYNAPNPDLTPEEIYYFDFDIKKQFSKTFYTGLSVYHYRVSDLIDTFENEDGLAQFMNQGNGRGTGGSLYSGFLFGQNVNLKFSYDFSRLKIKTIDGVREKAVNSPENLLKAHLLYRVPGFLQVGLSTYYESGRKTLNLGRTKSFWLTDVQLTSEKFLNSFRVAVKINNLFNQQYFYPAGYEHAMDQIVQLRRTVQFSVRVDL